MLHLVYSSQTELLLDALVSDVGEHRRRHGSLTPVQLVLPNRNVEAYLRFGIARATGIAANLDVHFLRRFVTELLSRGPSPVRLVDADVLRGLVLGLLLDGEVLRRPALAPVRSYLFSAGESPDAVDLRRFQLADQLSRLFEEYSYSRDAMLGAWPRGPVLGETPLADTEVWQRALWLEVCGPEGVLARRSAEEGVRWVHLGVAHEVLRASALELPPCLHVFGLSYVARAFQRILGVMAERTELRVYSLNPCREYWEDVETERESVRRRARRPQRLGVGALTGEDPFALVQEGDTPALRLWGRPGRESIRLLNELAECDFVEAFPDVVPGGGGAGVHNPLTPSLSQGERGSWAERGAGQGIGGVTLLQRLQQDILLRAPVPPEPLGVGPDSSVQVLACPGVRREAEAVAESIWSLLEEEGARAKARGEPPLRFNDIAVLVAGKDKAAYFSHLSSAFRACHDIPHNVVDLSFTSESRMAEAVDLLLAVPLGGFSRPEVLRVLTHPAALARFPGVDADRWIAWCERLGIVHGADREDHAGTYIERDVLNWDQGLRRLALGAFMAGARGDDAQTLKLGEEVYLPEEVDRGNQPHAVHLAMAVRSLLADARFARKEAHSLPEWARFMAALVEAHLAPANEFEARELERCLGAVRSLAEVDLDGRKVSYRIAYELVAQALRGMPGSRGQHLADGVVVSSLQPMRAIPFRAVFVVGLGEGEFPSVDRRDLLDLRRARPQAGDVSSREQDRYAFLETLLCTRDRLTLSYVRRNALSGEELEPSSVVHELLGMLEQGYLGAGARASVVRDVPEAHADAAAVKLKESLREVLGDGVMPELHVLRRAMRPETRARLDARLGVLEVPPRVGGSAKVEALRLSLSDLRRFLECPLQGYASRMLGLEEVEEGDARERQDELFATPGMDAVVRLRRVFLASLGQGVDRRALSFEGEYGRVAERMMAAGQAPLGVFGAVEREEHLAVLGQWGRSLLESPMRSASFSTHWLGGAAEGEAVGVRHAALVMEVAPRVEVRGRIDGVTEGPSGALVLQVRSLGKGWQEDVRRMKAALRGWVDHLALAAAGVPAESGHQVRVLVGGKEPGTFAFRFKPVRMEEARVQLAELAGEMLSGPHDYLLPCEAVFLSRSQNPPGDLTACVGQVLGTERLWHSSLSGPVRRIEDFRAPAPEVAEAMVERRFGPFFAQLEALEE